MASKQRIIIESIQNVPRAFAAAFAKINAALRILQAMANMEGSGGITITKTENNWVIDASGVQGGGGNALEPRVYNVALTVAGTVPTAAEIVSALESVSFTDDEPRIGDIINLTVSGDIKFRSTLTQTAPADTGTLWSQSLTLGGETWYAMTHQTGLY